MPNSNRISIKASRGFLNAKNKKDHKKFNASCIMKKVMAILLFDEFQTRYNAIPIMIYRIVHAGPNTQFGGLKEGFVRVEYQVSMDVDVNIPAMNPTSKQTPIEMTSLR